MFIPTHTSTGTTSHPCPNPADIITQLFVPLESVEELPLPAPADPLERPPDPAVPDELPPLDPELPEELPPLELPELPPELPELPPLDPPLLPPELPPEPPPLEPPAAGAARTVCARSRAQSTASAPTDENFMI